MGKDKNQRPSDYRPRHRSCLTCGGTGKMVRKDIDGKQVRVTCTACGGTGRISVGNI